jgi:hypothetical protein
MNNNVKINPIIVALFGGIDDYERLQDEEQKKLSLLPLKLKEESKVLKKLIMSDSLYIMDKEYGCPMPASGIVGYKGSKLMIFLER